MADRELADQARRLAGNLGLLAARNPHLADSIRQAVPDPRLGRATARNGLIVPTVRTTAGEVPLHSLYDPRQEGRKLAETLRGFGCLAVSGLGGGFHIQSMLEDASVSAVLVIEKDPGVLRSLLHTVDYSPLFADARVWIVCGSADILPSLSAAWKPALAGGMKTAQLRAWCDLERPFFDAVSAEIQSAVESIRADYGVQAHFGKRWFTHIVANLPLLRPAPTPTFVSAAAVTGAGPSLDLQIPLIRGRRRDALLLATDTSLPALTGRGIDPDAVLSIDCQVYGYHHFLKGLPESTSLYLDLASPPLLARRHRAPVFVASGHPMVRYIDAHWLRLPRVDTSGGNVTHAAVTLARALGARTIAVYGADFSYPLAKAYARGTYLYDYFRARQDRLAPAESSLLSFALSHAERRPILTTPLLLSYRDRFLALMDSIDAQVVPAEGIGLALAGSRRESGASPAAAPAQWPSASPAGVNGDWKEFLSGYADRLRALGSFSGGDREIVDTLLPIAARIIREGSPPGETAMDEARRWALQRIGRTLDPKPG
jgi:hypothetical protein